MRNSWTSRFHPGLITRSFREKAALWLTCWGSCNARCLCHPKLRALNCCQHGMTRAEARAQFAHREQLLHEIYTFMADHTAKVCAPAYLLLDV